MKTDLTSSKRKKMRNQEIYIEYIVGILKEDICRKCHLSLTQLNRILRQGREEAEEWYRCQPRHIMVQIFRYNCSKIFEEIRRLEEIRNKIKDDFKTEFDMTWKIINAYSNYNKLVAEGPSLTRQKEVTESAEKLLESTSE